MSLNYTTYKSEKNDFIRKFIEDLNARNEDTKIILYINSLATAWEDDILTREERLYLDVYQRALRIDPELAKEMEVFLCRNVANIALKNRELNIGINYIRRGLSYKPDDGDLIEIEKKYIYETKKRYLDVSFDEAVTNVWVKWIEQEGDQYKRMFKELLKLIWEDFKITIDERNMINRTIRDFTINPDINLSAAEMSSLEIEILFKIVHIAETYGKDAIIPKLLNTIIELDSTHLSALAKLEEIDSESITEVVIAEKEMVYNCIFCGASLSKISDSGDFYCSDCGSHSDIYEYDMGSFSLFKDKIISNKYKIRRKLKKGGMALIFLANDNLDNMFYVIKCPIHEGDEFLDTIRNEYIKREAQTIKMFNHPNIVKFKEVIEHRDKHYLVEEYIDGFTIEQRCMKKQLNLFHLHKWSKDLIETLGVIHSKNIIHRDINPKNIMIDKKDNIKFIDFGTAKELFDGLNKATLIGSRFYVPPEQISNGIYCKEGDLYSLASTLYFMCTGKDPIIINGKLQLIRGYNEIINRLLYDFISNARHEKRTYRYSSAAEMLDDFNAIFSQVLLPSEEQIAFSKDYLSKKGFKDFYLDDYKFLENGKLLLSFNLIHLIRNNIIKTIIDEDNNLTITTNNWISKMCVEG